MFLIMNQLKFHGVLSYILLISLVPYISHGAASSGMASNNIHDNTDVKQGGSLAGKQNSRNKRESVELSASASKTDELHAESIKKRSSPLQPASSQAFFDANVDTEGPLPLKLSQLYSLPEQVEFVPDMNEFENEKLYYANADGDAGSDIEIENEKRMREFVGKRAREFVGKRAQELVDKRAREFVGKRAFEDILEDEKRMREFVGKRAREFVGKRMREFVGKRDFASDYEKRMREFVGKRAREFVGKRAREFVGKRNFVPSTEKRMREFVGKRAREFVGKRAREFVGKRANKLDLLKRMRDAVGKRAREFVGKRAREFVGKRSDNLGSLPSLQEKRAREFVGKRFGDLVGDQEYQDDSNSYIDVTRLQNALEKLNREEGLDNWDFREQRREFSGKPEWDGNLSDPDGVDALKVSKRIREFVGKRSGVGDELEEVKRMREFVGKRSREVERLHETDDESSDEMGADKRMREFVGKRDIDENSYLDKRSVNSFNMDKRIREFVGRR